MSGYESKPEKAACAPDAADPQELDSRQLLGPAKQIKIRHGADVYELRETRLGKLILTK